MNIDDIYYHKYNKYKKKYLLEKNNLKLKGGINFLSRFRTSTSTSPLPTNTNELKEYINKKITDCKNITCIETAKSKSINTIKTYINTKIEQCKTIDDIQRMFSIYNDLYETITQITELTDINKIKKKYLEDSISYLQHEIKNPDKLYKLVEIAEKNYDKQQGWLMQSRDKYQDILNNAYLVDLTRDTVLNMSIPEIISKYSKFTQMMSDTLSTEAIKTLKQMTSYQIFELLKELQKKRTELFIRMTNVELEMDRYKYILNLRDNVLQRSIPKEIISKYSEFTQMMSDTLSTEVIKTLKQMTSYQIKELLKELQKKHTELFIRMTNVELEMDTLELRYKELHAASTKI